MTQPRRKMSTFVFLQKGMWHELILFSLLMPLLPKHTAVSQITRGLKLSVRSCFQRWCGFQKGLTVLNFGFSFFFCDLVCFLNQRFSKRDNISIYTYKKMTNQNKCFLQQKRKAQHKTITSIWTSGISLSHDYL